MTLTQTINEDIKTAMKAKDSIKLSTLRMLKAAIQNSEIEKKRELQDNEVIGVIRKEIKKRQDTIEMVGRMDMPEHNEIKILSAYLPLELSSEELAVIVGAAITELGATSKKDMGKVMKLVNEKVAGRAEGKAISTLIQATLK